MSNFSDVVSFGEEMTIKNKSEILKVIENDKVGPIGYVEIFDRKKKCIVFKGFNKVLIPASEFMAMRMFDLPSDTGFVTPSYNTVLGLDNSSNNTDNALSLKYKAFLFSMGTSGCARGSQIKYEVSNKQWINPEDLVPFRYVDITSDLSDVYRRIYYGKKTLYDKNKIAYYFKRFDSNPVVSRIYEDGTPWSFNIYDDETTLRANYRVALTFTIDEEDGRQWFDVTTGINDARFNTIQILAAWPETLEDGYTYYQDIRPLTRLNFPNRALSELGDSFEIRYFIYY